MGLCWPVLLRPLRIPISRSYPVSVPVPFSPRTSPRVSSSSQRTFTNQHFACSGFWAFKIFFSFDFIRDSIPLTLLFKQAAHHCSTIGGPSCLDSRTFACEQFPKRRIKSSQRKTS